MSAIPTPDRKTIEKEAILAYKSGTALLDACPYPLSSEAGRHFIAVFLLQRPIYTNKDANELPQQA